MPAGVLPAYFLGGAVPRMPDGAWDRRVLGAVLGFSRELEEHLHENLLRVRGLGDVVDAARAAARPHRVELHEIGVCECGGIGCAACNHTGVVHRKSGRPFRTPPDRENPRTVGIDEHPPPAEAATDWVSPGIPSSAHGIEPTEPPPRTAAEARARLLQLAQDFGELGRLLALAARKAKLLETEIKRVLGC